MIISCVICICKFGTCLAWQLIKTMAWNDLDSSQIQRMPPLRPQVADSDGWRIAGMNIVIFVVVVVLVDM